MYNTHDNSITVQIYQGTNIENFVIDKTKYMKITDRLHLSYCVFFIALCTLRSNQDTPGHIAYNQDAIFKNTSADLGTIFIRP